MIPPDTRERPANEGRWFVGRRDVLEAVLGFLDEPGRGYRLRVTGTWGIGKSALVDELEDRSKESAVVLKIRSGRYVPRAAPTGSGEVPPITLLQNWDCYATLLGDLCEHVGTEGFAVVEAQIARARERVAAVRTPVPERVEFRPEIKAKEIVVSESSSLASMFFSGAEPLHRLEAVIDEAKDSVTNAFVDELDRVAAGSGAVLLVDEFEKLRGHALALWILQLVADIRKSVVMLATRVAGPELEPYDVERHDLALFTAEEVREYLSHRLGGRPISHELVERVLNFSGGLPQAVAMAADLVEQRARAGDEAELGDLELDGDGPITTTLLSKIVSELAKEDKQEVARVVREGRLARRIDLDLVHWLLFQRSYEERTAEARRSCAAWETVKAYSFVEEYDPADLDGIGRFRFHEYITRAKPPPGDETLQVDEETVHECIAAFYERRRDDYDEERAEEPAYQQWYRYEDRVWQAMTREWLYHCGWLRSRKARKAARLELARVFLDAFWWWGCYIPFEFCEQLLDDWELTQPAADRGWSQALRQLLSAYPPGYRKVDRGDWAKVEEAIRSLREGAGLEGAVALEDRPGMDQREAKQVANQRRVRALTSLFRAHSYRHRSGLADLAVADYEDALAYLADDVAAHAWTTFELAELERELGHDEKAMAGIRAAARVAKSEGDYELLANLHRLRGDVAIFRNEAAETIANAAAKAVLRAYAFLVRPKPDPYTVAFYEEMRERLAARLVELAGSRGPDEAELAAAQVVEELTTLRADAPGPDPAAVRSAIDSRDEAALADLLTPRPPPLGDEALGDVRFAVPARRVRRAVDGDQADLGLSVPA